MRDETHGREPLTVVKGLLVAGFIVLPPLLPVACCELTRGTTWGDAVKDWHGALDWAAIIAATVVGYLSLRRFLRGRPRNGLLIAYAVAVPILLLMFSLRYVGARFGGYL